MFTMPAQEQHEYAVSEDWCRTESYGCVPYSDDGCGSSAYCGEQLEGREDVQQQQQRAARVTVVVTPAMAQHHFGVGLVHPCGITAWLPCPPGCLPQDLAAHAARLWCVPPRDNAALAVCRVTRIDEAEPLDGQVSPWDMLHSIPPAADAAEKQQQPRRRRSNGRPTGSAQYLGIVHTCGEAGWVAYHPGHTTPTGLRVGVAGRWGVRDDAFDLCAASHLEQDRPLEHQCAHLEILHLLWDVRLQVPAAAKQYDAAPPPPPPPRYVHRTALSTAKAGMTPAAAAPNPAAPAASALLLRLRNERVVLRAAFRSWLRWKRTLKKPAVMTAPAKARKEGSAVVALRPTANEQQAPQPEPRRRKGRHAVHSVAAAALAAANTRLLRSKAYGALAAWCSSRRARVA